jgi:hypothetical protein
MPNRLAVVKVLTQAVLGAQIWNGLRGETVNMPVEDYERVEEASTAILETVARAVNWDRLLMEAYWRHMRMHEDEVPDEVPDERWQPTTSEVCGECLREALLAEDRGAQDWDKHPSTPLRHNKTDWPTIVAEELEHRSVATWHPYKD